MKLFGSDTNSPMKWIQKDRIFSIRNFRQGIKGIFRNILMLFAFLVSRFRICDLVQVEEK